MEVDDVNANDHPATRVIVAITLGARYNSGDVLRKFGICLPTRN